MELGPAAGALSAPRGPGPRLRRGRAAWLALGSLLAVSAYTCRPATPSAVGLAFLTARFRPSTVTSLAPSPPAHLPAEVAARPSPDGDAVPGTTGFPWTSIVQSVERPPEETPDLDAVYAQLRAYREETRRPLMTIKQFAAAEPAYAARLQGHVNFDIPRTPLAALRTFFSHSTPRFIVAAFAATVAARARLPVPFGAAEAAVAVATGCFWCVHEWVIHAKLLHSEEAWFGERVHRLHHELPYYHVSLDKPDLAATWFGAVGVLAGALAVTSGAAAPCLTAVATYTLFGGIYEAAHFLAHTTVPLPPPLARVRRHHMKHHTVDASKWLAFTVPAVDSVFGTNPSVAEAVRERKRANLRQVSS